MKHFLIKYTRKNGSEAEWHQDVARFIAALDSDPGLQGISYRCMRRKGGDEYFHLASVADDDAVKALQQREFFSRYTEQTRQVGGGEVEVIGLEVVAETKRRT